MGRSKPAPYLEKNMTHMAPETQRRPNVLLVMSPLNRSCNSHSSLKQNVNRLAVKQQETAIAVRKQKKKKKTASFRGLKITHNQILMQHSPPYYSNESGHISRLTSAHGQQ